MEHFQKNAAETAKVGNRNTVRSASSRMPAKHGPYPRQTIIAHAFRCFYTRVFLNTTGILNWGRGCLRVAGYELHAIFNGLRSEGLVVSVMAFPVVVLLCILMLILTLPVFLFLLLGILVSGAWRLFVLTLQLLSLVPLAPLYIVTRCVQFMRRIFFTCPWRECGYRGFPAHVCRKCGEANDFLWPNWYGVLSHRCVGCGRRLPTLGILGKRQLSRCCGNETCRMPLTGRHAGKAPERLVALVGGPGSGKTSYMLMAINEVTNGKGFFRGEIDEPEQQKSFRHSYRRFTKGMVTDATVVVRKAYIMYLKKGNSRFQLYIYDAPGEEFDSFAGMKRQQYFSLIDGFILVVDPLSFKRVRDNKRPGDLGPTPLDDVVSSTLMKAVAESSKYRNEKVAMRVAVVISKADLPAVRERIGDIRAGKVDSAACRKAISEWGGANAIQGIENRFESVEYFACSALGRDPDELAGPAFKPHGVMPPLEWVLKG